MKKAMIKGQAERLIHEYGDVAIPESARRCARRSQASQQPVGALLGRGCARDCPVRASVAIGLRALCLVFGEQISA